MSIRNGSRSSRASTAPSEKITGSSNRPAGSTRRSLIFTWLMKALGRPSASPGTLVVPLAFRRSEGLSTDRSVRVSTSVRVSREKLNPARSKATGRVLSFGCSAPVPISSFPSVPVSRPVLSILADSRPEIGASRTPSQARAGAWDAISAAATWVTVALMRAVESALALTKVSSACAGAVPPPKRPKPSARASSSGRLTMVTRPSPTCQTRSARRSSSVSVNASASIRSSVDRAGSWKMCSIRSSRSARLAGGGPEASDPNSRSNRPSASRRIVACAPAMRSERRRISPRRSRSGSTWTSSCGSIAMVRPAPLINRKSSNCSRGTPPAPKAIAAPPSATDAPGSSAFPIERFIRDSTSATAQTGRCTDRPVRPSPATTTSKTRTTSPSTSDRPDRRRPARRPAAEPGSGASA